MNVEVTTNESPRRWLRFSLRSVTLLMTIVGILLGVFGLRYRHSIQQKHAVDALMLRVSKSVMTTGNPQ